MSRNRNCGSDPAIRGKGLPHFLRIKDHETANFVVTNDAFLLQLAQEAE